MIILVSSKKTAAPVTIIIPTHSAPIDDVVSAVKKQDYKGKVTIIALDNGERDRKASMPKGIRYIKNEKNLGLAGSLNKGIRLAKTDLVITLHQDCVPQHATWLSRLLAPFSDKRVVLSASKQTLPRKVWKKFSFWHKVFAVPELALDTAPHERATAYRRDVLLKCGLFDNTTYKTAGEDTDLFLKMQRHGTFVVPDAHVAHVHAPHNDSLWKFMTTFIRCHEAMGVLHRRFGADMGFQFYYDIIRTGLVLFGIVFLFYAPLVSLAVLGIIVLLANKRFLGVVSKISDIRVALVPFVFTFVWFATLFVTWKGFITGKQDLC